MLFKMPNDFKLDVANENDTSDSDSENLMIDEEEVSSDDHDFIDREAIEVSDEEDPSSDENDIKDNGIELGSDDTEEDDSDESDDAEDDSFVDDGPVINELLSGTGDDLSSGNDSDLDLDQSLSKKQKYNATKRRSRIIEVSDSSSDDENDERKTASVAKKLNSSTSSDDSKKPKLKKFEGIGMLKNGDESDIVNENEKVSNGKKNENNVKISIKMNSENNYQIKETNTKNVEEEIGFSSDDTITSNKSEAQNNSVSNKNEKLTKFRGTSSLKMYGDEKNDSNRQNEGGGKQNNCTEVENGTSFQELDKIENNRDMQMKEIDEENVSSSPSKDSLSEKTPDNSKNLRKKLRKKNRKSFGPKEKSTSPDVENANDSYLEKSRERRLKKKLDNRKSDEDKTENEANSENENLEKCNENQNDVPNDNTPVKLSKKERKPSRLNYSHDPEGASINHSLEKKEKIKKRHRSISESDELLQKKLKKRKKATASGHFTVEKLSKVIKPSTKGSTNFKNEMLYSSRIKRQSTTAFLQKQSKLS